MRVVAALAGLLAAVAYADPSYSSAEEALVRSVLARVHGMTPAGVEAVCGGMRRHVVEASTVQIPHFARELRELADGELRRVVLDALVDLAAADDDIATRPKTSSAAAAIRLRFTVLARTTRSKRTAEGDGRRAASVSRSALAVRVVAQQRKAVHGRLTSATSEPLP